MNCSFFEMNWPKTYKQESLQLALNLPNSGRYYFIKSL